jgi:glycerate 2-kinase
VSLVLRAPDPATRPGWRPALSILAAAVAAADPAAAVRRALAVDGSALVAGEARVDLGDVDRIFLVAAGKAATAMVQAAEATLGERIRAGVAVTSYGAGGSATRTTIHEAGHPMPDPSGLMATRHIARVLDQTTERDLVLALISGGGSALLEMPAGRIPLIDIQSTTSSLLACGATIDEMNCVRKHISAVKGGGLARLAAPASVIALVLSDVVGSPLDVIASGPTVPDPTTYADAAAILSRYELWGQLPASIGEHLRRGLAGDLPETLKPGDPLFNRVITQVIGENATAAAAAAAEAQSLGYATLLLTTFLEGEAREVGQVLAAIGKELATHGRPLAPPACVIAGGETTVTLRRLGGRGGRNQELALAAALALDGPAWAGVTLASMGTDGIDGATDAAGAIVDGTTAARARAAGLDPADALARHDSGAFFAALGDGIVTGPTGTNVNDLVVVLVGAEG